MSASTDLADTIAKSSISLYNSLRKHGKPAVRPNGVEEWTILATISLVFPSRPTRALYSYTSSSSSDSVNHHDDPLPTDSPEPIRVVPVSLGTGVKVLPANRLPPLGDAVHDSHAEVLARRGFVRWLLEEGKKAVIDEVAASTTSTGGTGTEDSAVSGDGGKRRRRRRGGKALREDNSSDGSPEVVLRTLPDSKEVKGNVAGLGKIDETPELGNGVGLGSHENVKTTSDRDQEGKSKRRRKKKQAGGMAGSSSDGSPLTLDTALPQDTQTKGDGSTGSKRGPRPARSRGRGASKPKEETFMIWRDGKLRFKDGIEIWLYVSTLPCGDASMLHTAAHQDPEIASLKAISPPSTPNLDLPGASTDPESPKVPLAPTLAHAVRGRNGYDNFGAIRTKPGRADSTPTISLSCSDKIAGWTVLGLQGALLEDLFGPVYLSGIVIGGVENDAPCGWHGRPGKAWREVIGKEVERALWGRLGPLIGRLPVPFELHPPAIRFTDVDFTHSKTAVAAYSKPDLEPAPSTLSLTYIPALMKKGAEVLYNGTRQSSTWKPPGTELLKPKARASVCKIEIMWAYLGLVELVCAGKLKEGLGVDDHDMSYHDLKHRFESPYQRAKTLIRGSPTTADTLHSAFGTIGPFDVTFAPDAEFCMALPPFSGWIISGKRFESFNKHAELLLPLHLWPTLPPRPPPGPRVDAGGPVSGDPVDVPSAVPLPLTPPSEVLGLGLGQPIEEVVLADSAVAPEDLPLA